MSVPLQYHHRSSGGSLAPLTWAALRPGRGGLQGAVQRRRRQMCRGAGELGALIGHVTSQCHSSSQLKAQ